LRWNRAQVCPSTEQESKMGWGFLKCWIRAAKRWTFAKQDITCELAVQSSPGQGPVAEPQG